MPRFYFNVTVGTAVIADDEGTDLPTLQRAQEEALKDARALMSDAVLLGRDVSHRHIEICDEQGAVLLVVPFLDAIKRFE